MQHTPKLSELQAADLGAPAELALQAEVLAVGGAVLPPAEVVGLAEALLEALQAADLITLPPIIHDHASS